MLNVHTAAPSELSSMMERRLQRSIKAPARGPIKTPGNEYDRIIMANRVVEPLF
jgi:hypothetical protein